jgi:hypothetical protein
MVYKLARCRNIYKYAALFYSRDIHFPTKDRTANLHFLSQTYSRWGSGLFLAVSAIGRDWHGYTGCPNWTFGGDGKCWVLTVDIIRGSCLIRDWDDVASGVLQGRGSRSTSAWRRDCLDTYCSGVRKVSTNFGVYCIPYLVWLIFPNGSRFQVQSRHFFKPRALRGNSLNWACGVSAIQLGSLLPCSSSSKDVRRYLHIPSGRLSPDHWEYGSKAEFTRQSNLRHNDMALTSIMPPPASWTSGLGSEILCQADTIWCRKPVDLVCWVLAIFAHVMSPLILQRLFLSEFKSFTQ